MYKRMIPEYSTLLMTEIWKNSTSFVYDYNHIGIPTTISDTNATTLYYLLYAKYGNNPIANYDITQFKYKMFSVVFQYGPTWEKKLSIQDTLRGLNIEDLVNDGSIDELFNHTGVNGFTENTTDSSSKFRQDQGSSTVDHSGAISLAKSNTIENSGDDTTVSNHAFNPSSSPATNAFSPLNYINQQDAEKVTKGTKSDQIGHDITSFGNSDTTTSNTAGQEASDAAGSRSLQGNDLASDVRTRTLNKGKLSAYEHLIELLDANITNEFLSRFKYCFKQFIAPERPTIYISESDDEDEED